MIVSTLIKRKCDKRLHLIATSQPKTTANPPRLHTFPSQPYPFPSDLLPPWLPALSQIKLSLSSNALWGPCSPPSLQPPLRLSRSDSRQGIINEIIFGKYKNGRVRVRMSRINVRQTNHLSMAIVMCLAMGSLCQFSIQVDSTLLFAQATSKNNIITVESDGAVRLWSLSNDTFNQTHNITVPNAVASTATPCQDVLATVTRNGSVYMHQLCSNTNQARLIRVYPTANLCYDLRTVGVSVNQNLDGLLTMSDYNVAVLWALADNTTYTLESINIFDTRPQAMAVGAISRTVFVNGNATYLLQPNASNQMNFISKTPFAVTTEPPQTVTVSSATTSVTISLANNTDYYNSMQTSSGIDLNCSVSTSRAVECEVKDEGGGGLSTGGIVALAVAIPLGVLAAVGVAIGVGAMMAAGSAGAATPPAVLTPSAPSFAPVNSGSSGAIKMPELSPPPQQQQQQRQKQQQNRPQPPRRQPPPKPSQQPSVQNFSTGTSLPGSTGSIVGAGTSSAALSSLASLAVIPALAVPIVGATAAPASTSSIDLPIIKEQQQQQVITLQLT